MTEKLGYALLVDDNEVTNFVSELILTRCGLFEQVLVVLNGEEAKGHFENNPDSTPSFVLLDINMPLMDGFQFLDWFSQSPFKGQCKIAMFSTSIRTEDKKRAFGHDDVIGYIEKPISQDVIIKLFNDQLGQQ